MKTWIFLFIGLYLLVNYTARSMEVLDENNNSKKRAINVSASPDLFDLAMKWAGEYSAMHPDLQVKVKVHKGRQDQITTQKGADLYLFSSVNFNVRQQDSLWKIVVGRDVIVPIMNSKNPLLKKINTQGVSSEGFARLFLAPERRTWGILLGNPQNAPVHYYMVNHGTVESRVATFLAIDQRAIIGIPVENSDKMIAAIQKDPYGLGFCALNDVLDPGNQCLVDHVKILPVDKNNNGNLDYFENIYSNMDAFIRGVWIGKYPKELCRAILAVSPLQQSNPDKIAFLTWVLTEGQTFLNAVGHSDLAYSDLQKQKLGMLAGGETNIPILAETGLFAHKLNDVSIFSLIILILMPFLLGFMIWDARKQNKKVGIRAAVTQDLMDEPRYFNLHSVATPKGLFFDKTHTWALMEKNGAVRIGMDDFLPHITGALTSVKMKNPGEKIKKGEPLFSIVQNGKQLIIYAPISGTVTSRNELLSSDASAINSAPYSDGWVYMVEPSGWLREIRFFTMSEKYGEWLKREFSRLREFLKETIKDDAYEHTAVILQDGGDLKEGVLADQGPKVWEDFQTKFIDISI